MGADIVIGKAESKDLDKIHQLMELARVEQEKSGFFCADDIEYIKEHICDQKKGLVLKAEKEKVLAGFFILHVPQKDEENMGSYKGLAPEELDKVIYFDSTVVNPAFRGMRIMDAFLTSAEQLLQDMPYEYYFATVHPDNRNSYKNLLAHDFEIVTTITKYGGMLRHIMYRRK